jgi:predicted RND superfamily exporter protein
MWNSLAEAIIKYRLIFLIVIAAITAFMGWQATKIVMAYDFARTVPPEDPDLIYFNSFKQKFGEDGNIIVVGMQDSAVYHFDNFQALRELASEIKKINGVTEVISLPTLKMIVKDTTSKSFRFQDIFPEKIVTQQSLDSLLQKAMDQKIYSGQIINSSNGAMMMLVAVKKEVMNSKAREAMTDSLVSTGSKFEQRTNIKLRYAGLPFMRTIVANSIRSEMKIFLIASVVITGLIMFLFFRSFRAVLFSMIIIGVLVVWTLGTLALFGYKITLLTGLIPPVIVTIGITNAIYLLNKYHLEFQRTKNKIEAINAVVKKMGLAMFLTNLTVAIGFLTLLATDITILREFGIVAGINIMALFFVCLIMIPSVLSWLPVPNERHMKHLNFRILNKFLELIDLSVHRHRLSIYAASFVLVLLSAYGMMQLKAETFMADDVPAESQVKKDLKFFEANFSGVMPLEIVVQFITKKKRPVLDVKNLGQIEEFEAFLDSIPLMSRPVSVVSFVKGLNQAFYNGNPNQYKLPSKAQGAFLMGYVKNSSLFRQNTDWSKNDSIASVKPDSISREATRGVLNSFVDSTFTTVRISTQIADIGSSRLDSLVNDVIEPRMKEIFVPTGKDSVVTHITGSTKIFIKGNKFLIANLKESLLLAFILITLSMAILFANVRMIVISLIPNLLALMITAGLMGYFNIPLKASTALIFSITFGISVDNSIRFLAKYRQEILSNNFFIPVAVSESILETGKSIIYTSIVLFAGFIIFAFSSFGGTIALGLLTSTTLVISMFTNLILLPALIMTFDRPKRKKGEHLLIDDFDSSFYGEQEDEEIDLSKIKIHSRNSSEAE